jgi:hypothetical protein
VAKRTLLAALVLMVVSGLSVFSGQNFGGSYSSNTARETAAWSVLPWLSLSIRHSFPDLGAIGFQDSADFIGKNYLFVRGNASWELSARVTGALIAGHCPDYFLSVSLSPNKGSASTVGCGREVKVKVDYHLKHLECLPPGNYLATIIYTATVK